MNVKYWTEAKAKHPDLLLLFRMGDYYNAFKGDAEIVSIVIGTTLIRESAYSKYKGLSMTGFPHYQLEEYLKKLMKAGHRVAVCEEVE